MSSELLMVLFVAVLSAGTALGVDPSFSFVYRGRHSSTFLKHWKRISAPKATIWQDPETGLEVELQSKTLKDTGGIDWTVVFTNHGTKPTPIIEQVFAVDLTYDIPKGNVIHHGIHGSAGPDTTWLPYDVPIPVGSSIELGAPTGRPAETTGPFFNVQWPGGGVVTAVGWSGCWQGLVTRPSETTVRVQAGMKHCHLSLDPGESIRTPRIVQLAWNGTDESDAYVKWRRMMLAHFHPLLNGKPVMPPIVRVGPDIDAFPMDKMNEYSESAVLKEIADVSTHGFEYCWVDAYFTKWGFGDGMGNYALPVNSISDPVRFPRGMAPIADAAHKAGLKFLLWFEPERVAPNTSIAKMHPEFVISPGGNGSGMFNLGDPHAREYMTNVLSTAITEWKMDCLRIDYNYHPLAYWQFENAKNPNRVGVAEIRYVEGLYRLWDDLLKLHPGLMIDNCASGGTRIEIELCSRSIPLWRTDDTIGPFFDRNYNRVSILNQSMSAGLNRYVPFSISGGIGTDPYNFRSGFNGGICPIDAPGPEKHAELRAAIAEGKRLRKYYLGDYYALSPVDQDPEHWCAMQFNRPKERDGMAVLFRREACASSEFSLSVLRGLDPSSSYSVWVSYGYDRGKVKTMKGSDLLAMMVKVNAKPGSVVVEYQQSRK